jgi:hypothetical protein
VPEPVISVGQSFYILISGGNALNFSTAPAEQWIQNSPPPVASASGTTWSGQNWGVIPFEWMTEYFGALVISFNNDIPSYNWPSPNMPPPGASASAPTLLQIFLSGANPLDPSTWLTAQLLNTPQGLFLTWNPQPGLTYQVQVTTNFTAWSNLGAPRLAASNSDSINVTNGSGGYYRIMLLRQ